MISKASQCINGISVRNILALLSYKKHDDIQIYFFMLLKAWCTWKMVWIGLIPCLQDFTKVFRYTKKYGY